MIYHAKPQRGGKSIPTNTNTPLQDPPAPLEYPIVVEPVEIIKPIKVIPSKVTKKVTPKKPKIVKLTIKQKISRFLKKIFRRV